MSHARGDATSAAAERTPPGVVPLVGRGPELDLLLARLESLDDGFGGIVMLVGEPGIGKTRVAQEIGREARGRGVAVLWGRCFEDESPRPFGPWVEALGRFSRGRPAAQLGANPALIRQLLSGSPSPEGEQAEGEPRNDQAPDGTAPTPSPPPSSERFRLYDAVSSLLQTIAAERPVVLVLDDLHWIDRDSLAMLRYVAVSLPDDPILLLGTYREADLDDRHPLRAVLAELEPEPHFEQIILPGLAEQSVAELVVASTGRNPSPPCAQWLHAETEGNPLYVRQLVRHLLDERGPTALHDGWTGPDQLGVPAGVRSLVSRRLAWLPDDVVRVVQVAAGFPRGFDLDVLRLALGHQGDQVLDGLRVARRAALIRAVQPAGRYRFSHAMVRRTIYDDLGTRERAAIHQRVGLALERRYAADPGPHLAELAFHFSNALLVGGAEKALAYARRAAEWAARSLAYGEAAAHYERALELLETIAAPGPDLEDQRYELTIGAAESHWGAGEGPAAREMFLRAARRAGENGGPHAGQRMAHAILGCSPVWILGTGDPVQVRLIGEALAALGPDDTALRARLLATLSRELYFSAEHERSLALSEEAVATAHTAGDPVALAHALVARHLAIWTPEYADEMGSSAEQLVRVAGRTDEHVVAAHANAWWVTHLLERGDLATANRIIAEQSALANRLQTPFHRWRTAAYGVLRGILTGRFAEVELLLDQIGAIGLQTVNNGLNLFRAVQEFTLRREQGRIAEMEATIRWAAESFPSLPVLRLWPALVHAELGRRDEALAVLDAVDPNDLRDRPRDVSWSFFLGWAAEAAILLKDTRRAALLYDLLLPHADRIFVIAPALVCDGAVDRYLGRLAASLDRHEAAVHHFKRALATHERLEAWPLLAYTRFELAELLLGRGRAADRPRARDLLRQADRTAQELGMTRLGAQVAERSRAASIRLSSPRDPATPPPAHAVDPEAARLSRREREVAALIARGYATRAIAEELVIGARTVEAHVMAIFNKLGVSSRAQIAVWAVDHGLRHDPPT